MQISNRRGTANVGDRVNLLLLLRPLLERYGSLIDRFKFSVQFQRLLGKA